MKTLLLVICISLIAVGGAGSALLIVEFRQNQRLAAANDHLRHEVDALKAELADLQREQTDASDRLAAALDESGTLSNRLHQIESIAAAPADATPATPRPRQARAWLGQEFIGWAWITARYARTNSETGVPEYEPVVWFEDRMRDKFVSYVTNVVEREIPTSYTTVNNRYYPRPYYFFTHPPHGGKKHTSPQGTPAAPAAPPQFNPGSGGLPTSKIAIPAATIKTRPQVLGIPAGQIKTMPAAELAAPATQ